MKRSTDHILTTHAGRLDGPPDLRAQMGAILSALGIMAGGFLGWACGR